MTARTTSRRKPTSTATSTSSARIDALADVVGYRIEELLATLGVSLRLRGKMYTGPCPIHGGNNPSAFNLYPDGFAIRGNWVCRTHHCERTFKPTILGFVQGVLSHQQYNWPGPRMVSFKDTIDWLCEFVGKGKLEDIEVDLAEVEKRKFAQRCELIGRTPQESLEGWSRETVRQRLLIPAQYFLDRGFSAEILDKYDVGLSQVPPAHPMCERVVVPVFDPDYRRVIGVTGRSIHEKCPHCQRYHGGDCPTDERGLLGAAKWVNSHFQKESCLYNYWFAQEHIRKSGLAVLVEGQGDVWRLEESGIHEGLGLFGTALNDPQQVILERSGAFTLVILTDGDAAGQDARKELEKLLGRSYRLCFPRFPEGRKDVGELTPQEIRNWLLPIIEPLRNK